MDFVSIISLSTGFIGIAIALYQGSERRKLQHYLNSQSWHIFTLVNMSFAATQTASKLYKERNCSNIDAEIIELLAKSDSLNTTLFIESIRQINLSEQNFNFETIALWKQQGKINEEQEKFFIKAMPLNKTGPIKILYEYLKMKLNKRVINIVDPNNN